MNTAHTEHSQDTRRRLMESALYALAEKGFDGVGIREIAQNAKANPAMIAYYFGSKEGLYDAAMRWVTSHSFLWLSEMPALPDPASPDAHKAALSGIKEHLAKLFDNMISSDRPCALPNGHLQAAAKKLWSLEMENPKPSLMGFAIEQLGISTEYFIACMNILRPDLSKLELEAMVLCIRGPILFLHKHFSIIQKLRGEPFTDGDLEKLARYFVDFSLRGLGVPDFIPSGGTCI
jgi:AcrR family transcriptional regulator